MSPEQTVSITDGPKSLPEQTLSDLTPWTPTPSERWCDVANSGRGSGSGIGSDSGSGVRPARPLPEGMSVVAYIRELVSRHGLTLSAPAEQAWQCFEDRLASCWPPPERRTLRLEPHAQDRIPADFEQLHIDVALRGVDGRSSLYSLREVTGVDERVQAVVASQEVTAHCLLAALQWVEEEDLHRFSFVCHGATHRSVASCFLFAALVYPKASVHLTTLRTRRAAATAGLPLPPPRRKSADLQPRLMQSSTKPITTGSGSGSQLGRSSAMHGLHSFQAFALRHRQSRLEREGATAMAAQVGAEAEAEEAKVAAAEAKAEADWDGRGVMPVKVRQGRLRANRARCRAERLMAAEAAEAIVVEDTEPQVPVAKVPAKARPTQVKAKAAAPGRLIGRLLLQARCRAQQLMAAEAAERLMAAEAAEVIVVEGTAPLVPVTKAWASANRRRMLPVKTCPPCMRAKAAAPVKRMAMKTKAAAPAKVRLSLTSKALATTKAAVEAKAVEAKAVAKAAAPAKVAAKAVFDFDAFRATVDDFDAYMNNPMVRARPIPSSAPPPKSLAPKRHFDEMD